MPMNPRLMRPKAAGNTVPQYAPAGYTRLWAVTTCSSGNITGSAETDSGYYAVKWWDNTTDIYDSGDPFSKAALGNQRAFEVYPCDSGGTAGGAFTGFDVSDNCLTQLRAEDVSLSSSAGYNQYNSYYPYTVYVPGTAEVGDLSDNDLTGPALDQFYTDLDNGTGDLFVQGNYPGIVDDDPTIATGKGYTVFGSVPPSTTLLLHFDGTNGATSTTDDSPENHSITFTGDAEISTTQSKFGGSSGRFTLTPGTLTIPYSPTTEFDASEDFTVELWARFDSLSSYRDVAGTHTANEPIGWLLQTNGADLRFFASAGGSTDIAWGVTLSTGTWYHIAMARQAGTLRCFLDGTLATSQSVTHSLECAEGFAIGRAGPIDGYIDDIRIVKGAALYTANFTPPTGPLTVYP